MNRESKYGRVLRALNHYVVFFLLIAFVVTCCTALFASMLATSLGVTFTEENIQAAAKATFINVLLLSLLLCAIDILRRRLTVDRPVRQITEATQRMMAGDFSVRIHKKRVLDSEDRFGEIIDCFNRMAEELASVETLRTDFVANVSHELKTPLAVMQNYGTMLGAPDLPEEKRLEYAKGVTAAARRLATLITNILKLNRLENQQITQNPVRYDLGEQLCECLLGFEDAWEQKGLEIETEIEEGVLVRADAEMMSLVWNNLFSNAIKFTEPGGRIRLRLVRDVEGAVVQVSDTGCGISPEVGAHIFDKFYQGDTSHATQGNGLGLALVRRVIDLTGSDISVESEVGVGTTFTVRIRRAAE